MNRKLKNSELGRLSTDEFKDVSKIPVTVVLDSIRSFHNVGSVFRTSDAFRIERIVLCGISPKPPHREIHKTALGSTESVDWQYIENIDACVVSLKQEGYTLLSVEQTENSTLLNQFRVDSNKKYALVFGNEVFGVRQSVVDESDEVIEIPQEGTKHSLNISVSVAIVLWSFFSAFKR
jgi:tRNA G18 (ribose-2'-O)-methylase SpoU